METPIKEYPNWIYLPNEMLLHIFSMCDDKSKFRMKLICKTFFVALPEIKHILSHGLMSELLLNSNRKEAYQRIFCEMYIKYHLQLVDLFEIQHMICIFEVILAMSDNDFRSIIELCQKMSIYTDDIAKQTKKQIIIFLLDKLNETGLINRYRGSLIEIVCEGSEADICLLKKLIPKKYSRTPNFYEDVNIDINIRHSLLKRVKYNDILSIRVLTEYLHNTYHKIQNRLEYDAMYRTAVQRNYVELAGYISENYEISEKYRKLVLKSSNKRGGKMMYVFNGEVIKLK